MKIRVVMPILNNMFLTAGAIMSLKAELGDELDLVLVDNGSDEETLAVLRADIDQKGSGIRMIRNEIPRAYSRSINMGAAVAGDWDVLLVTNNDVIYAPGSIEAMAAALEGYSELVLPLSPRCAADAAVTPPKLGRPTELAHVYANYEAVCEWWNRKSQAFRGISPIGHPYVKQGGYSFMISRALWDRLRGFDEDYELFGEDYDLFARAGRWTKIVQARSAYVEHLEHQSVTWLGEERDRRMCRSRFLLAEKQDGLKELVSVVIPTFNRTEALFEAIDSVLRQTMPHFRIYVVDDGSQDWDRIQTAARDRYKGQEGRLWFFHLSKNGGPGRARNFGLDQARGKYVAFLDSDDVWYPDHLARHLEFHERNPHLVMSYGRTDFSWRWWDEPTRRFRYKADNHPEEQLRGDVSFDRGRLERENYIKTSSVFVWGGILRRENEWSSPIRFVEAEDHRMAAEDWGFFRAIADRGPVALIPEVTARTHWSRNVEADEHHSSRIVAWAEYGAPPASWLAREVALPAVEDALVTIVTPTRERPEECARLAATVPKSVPIVFVADGARSGPPLVKLTQDAENIGLLVVESPKGPSFARNRGVEAALTPWVWFLDDDDVPLAGALEGLEDLAENADVLIGELVIGTTGSGKLQLASGIYTSALLVRVSTFQRAGGFDENSRWAEERDLLTRLENAGARVASIGRPIAIKTVGAKREHTLHGGRRQDPRILNPR